MTARSPQRLDCPGFLLSLATVLLLLGACQSLPPAQNQEPASWKGQQQSISEIDDWSLRGRLNVRQDAQNDTVNINWTQTGEDFDIRMSGTLGMGAVAVRGDASSIVVEKNGELPLALDSLDALSREYLDFDFPAAHLLYWVRGLPVPAMAMQATWNEQALLDTLIQTDARGQRWQLTFDRYQSHNSRYMPGRIRLEHDQIRLTFLINDWQLHPPLLARL